ncbi:hypothetical protein ACFL6A_01540 [bacterium]
MNFFTLFPWTLFGLSVVIFAFFKRRLYKGTKSSKQILPIVRFIDGVVDFIWIYLIVALLTIIYSPILILSSFIGTFFWGDTSQFSLSEFCFNIRISNKLEIVFLGFLILLIAEVFRIGIKLREENKLTI